MWQLYLDEFHGFRNSYLPLAQVNFLLGENSTGKTSVIKLLNVLFNSSHQLFEPDFDLFNNRAGKFGKYSDIVSSARMNAVNFKIGVINFPRRQSVSGGFTQLLTYVKSEDGMPKLSSISTFYGGVEWSMKREIVGCSYNAVAHDIREVTPEYSRKVFKKWLLNGVKSFKYKSKGNFGSTLSAISKRINKQVAVGNAYYANALYYGPIRNEPKRFYYEAVSGFSSEGAHTPHLLRSIKAQREFQKYLNGFGKESGLFKSIVSKDYGKDVDAPFEINVCLENKPISIINVGYGIAQTLPFVVDIIGTPPRYWFLLQQPEIHLHPKAQAAVGGLVYRFAESENKSFFIETHSDYLVDRFRIEASKAKKKTAAQVLFFKRSRGVNKVYALDISAGKYPPVQPKAFRDFFVRESMKLLAA